MYFIKLFLLIAFIAVAYAWEDQDWFEEEEQSCDNESECLKNCLMRKGVDYMDQCIKKCCGVELAECCVENTRM